MYFTASVVCSVTSPDLTSFVETLKSMDILPLLLFLRMLSIRFSIWTLSNFCLICVKRVLSTQCAISLVVLFASVY